MLKAWRCDLTALSQLCNLYFVAYDYTVQVFRPSFPDQVIQREPEVVLHPPISAPGLQAGIDPSSPHSITRLIVDYLGHEEILLAACDDGDVIGYRVEEIQRAVEQGRLSPAANHSAGIDIRVFLHRNVGRSAWGLAIHREARMIAISANTHQITVLAYALTDQGEEPSDTNSREREIPAAYNIAAGFPSLRRQDHVITLTASRNIPAVSFDNTGNDPRGRWLFSSSIDGKTMLWDIHNPSNPARIFQMGWCASTEHLFRAPTSCACPDIPHTAWGTIFLDGQSAHELPNPVNPNEEASFQVPNFKDMSHQKERFAVIILPLHIPPLNYPIYNYASDSEMAITDGESGESDAGELDEHRQQDSILASNTTTIDAAGDPSNDVGLHDQADDGGLPSSTYPPSLQEALDAYNPMATLTATELSILHLRAAKQSWSSYCEIETSPLFQSEPNTHSPCLIITAEDIFLIQRPISTQGDYTDPMVVMRQPLHPPEPLDPSEQQGLKLLPSSDRHCFYNQIPELGVFIVGSPCGRAAVFSLTKTRVGDDTQYTYGFQLEFLLPIGKETDGKIGLSMPSVTRRLMGVATGPVQGMYDGDKGGVRERRWRVLMYFSDHTVASFELSKRRVSEEPGLGDLVV